MDERESVGRDPYEGSLIPSVAHVAMGKRTGREEPTEIASRLTITLAERLRLPRFLHSQLHTLPHTLLYVYLSP